MYNDMLMQNEKRQFSSSVSAEMSNLISRAFPGLCSPIASHYASLVACDMAECCWMEIRLDVCEILCLLAT
jgi:hypothetical protein